MPTDAASSFSGKRGIERRVVDLRVELRGGGAVVEGRALDLSEVGVGVYLQASALAPLGGAADAVTALRSLERHFTSGLEVRLAGKTQIRVPAHVIRVSTAPKPSGDVVIGCRFDRPLTPTESASLLGSAATTAAATAPASSSGIPLPPLASGPRVQILVFDADLGAGGGPIYLLNAARASAMAVEAAVSSASAPTIDDVRRALGRPSFPIRMTTTGGLRWEGAAKLADAVNGPEGIVVRIEPLAPWPAWFSKRLARR